MVEPTGGIPALVIQESRSSLTQQNNQPTQSNTVSNSSRKAQNGLREGEASRDKHAAKSLSIFSPEEEISATFDATDAAGSALISRGTTVSGHDEEAVVYSNTRMLQDPTGRLCKQPDARLNGSQ